MHIQLQSHVKSFDLFPLWGGHKVRDSNWIASHSPKEKQVYIKNKTTIKEQEVITSTSEMAYEYPITDIQQHVYYMWVRR